MYRLGEERGEEEMIIVIFGRWYYNDNYLFTVYVIEIFLYYSFIYYVYTYNPLSFCVLFFFKEYI